MRKKWKVHGLEKALENVPENERAILAAEIEETLSDFDPADQPGEPVAPVPRGTRTCPSCGGKLVELGLIPATSPEHGPMCVLECETCDGTFCESVDEPLQ